MTDLKIVKSILHSRYDLEKNPTFIFGSRSNNTHRKNSDLDILIQDVTITPAIVTYLEEDFEQSSLAFKVDIVLRSRIADDFYNKIKDSLQRI